MKTKLSPGAVIIASVNGRASTVRVNDIESDGTMDVTNLHTGERGLAVVAGGDARPFRRSMQILHPVKAEGQQP